jgi:AraC-like DNA-binding protein
MTDRAFDWLLDSERPGVIVGDQSPLVVSDDFWQGSIERLQLGRTLRVYLNDLRINRDFKTGSVKGPLEECLVGHVTLAGAAAIGLDDGVTHTDAHRAVLFRRDEHPGVFGFSGGARYLSVGYTLALDQAEGLLGGEGPEDLQGLLTSGSSGNRVFASASDRRVRTLARRMFSTGLNGPLRRLALEGTALQLIAAQAAAVPPPRLMRALSAAERRAILHARERLLADMRAPPSLAALARDVKLSEKRLNAGFLELFGATVFEVLRDERLEHARKALKEGLSLKVIVHRVGYSHVSNFIHAYRARFGAPPRRHLRRDDED